ncbi:Protein of unknown function [Gryllus bimaculatus]|nr:Protein of unknown function [Gryllus bimaculatus]
MPAATEERCAAKAVGLLGPKGGGRRSAGAARTEPELRKARSRLGVTLRAGPCASWLRARAVSCVRACVRAGCRDASAPRGGDIRALPLAGGPPGGRTAAKRAPHPPPPPPALVATASAAAGDRWTALPCPALPCPALPRCAVHGAHSLREIRSLLREKCSEAVWSAAGLGAAWRPRGRVRVRARAVAGDSVRRLATLAE